MLVDFTVENYRSIKEPVTLSAVAQKQSDRQTSQSSKRKRVKSDHEIAPGYHVEGWDIELLPVLAIFGAVPFLPSDEEIILQGDEQCQKS